AHTKYLVRAHEWDKDRRDDLLLLGAEINHAEEWLKKADKFAKAAKEKSDGKDKIVNPLPSETQRKYILASRKKSDSEIEKTRQSEQLIQGLSMISSAMSVDTKINEICDLILRFLGGIINYDKSTIQIITGDHRSLVASKGFDSKGDDFLL